MTPEVVEASQALADELALTPAQVADMAVRYHELKNKTVRLVTSTGEKLSEGDWKKETDDLNTALRTYIEAQGLDGRGRYMAITVEGIPDLELGPRNTEEVDTAALLEHGPALFFTLVERNAMKVDIKAAKVVLNPDQLSGFLSQWVRKLGATPSLAFKKGPK